MGARRDDGGAQERVADPKPLQRRPGDSGIPEGDEAAKATVQQAFHRVRLQTRDDEDDVEVPAFEALARLACAVVLDDGVLDEAEVPEHTVHQVGRTAARRARRHATPPQVRESLDASVVAGHDLQDLGVQKRDRPHVVPDPSVVLNDRELDLAGREAGQVVGAPGRLDRLGANPAGEPPLERLGETSAEGLIGAPRAAGPDP
jgi:hypothetical protein